MVLVLVIGDIHIPHRAHDIPPQFKKLLIPGKIDKVLVTGNLCTKDVYDYLRTLSTDISTVAGEYDEGLGFEETKVLTIEGYRVGLCHGHQIIPWGDKAAIAMLQRQLNVDILITGHTHEFAAYELGHNQFVLNPGSATGSYSALNPNVVPTFILMDVRESAVILYTYKLAENGEVKVDRINWSKK